MPADPRPHTRLNRARTRTLTFRVTEEEFDRLQMAANHAGSSCLSEFIRQAALQIDPASQQFSANNWAAQQIHTVQQRINQLESQVSELCKSSRIQLVKAASE